MTPEQMRIAAAVSVGWIFQPQTGPLYCPWVSPSKKWEDRAANVPAYDTDLNAVAGLVSTLSATVVLDGPFYVSEQGRFNVELERIVQRDLRGIKGDGFYFDIINATAIERLEAYLCAKGLYAHEKA